MDKTEQYIWDKIKPQLPYLLEQARNYKFTTACKKLAMPVMIDGVIDEIIYDKRQDKFLSLRYSVGKGTCYKGFMDYYNDDKAGYFDDIEYRTLDIGNFPQ